MNFDPTPEIVRALEADKQLDFKRKTGTHFQQGICPACGKRELYISREKPFRLACNRANNCSYTESTRDRYPHLYNNFEERFPTTEADPKATANAYLAIGRGFPLEIIGNWFEQSSHFVEGINKTYKTVRFYIDANRERWWERLIDASKAEVKQRHNIAGRRKHFPEGHRDHAEFNGSLYKGEAWAPPGQQIEQGDTVFWVEGIFHAIALHLSGHKAIAALAANNFPSLFLRAHAGKQVNWVLALDNDKAGQSYMRSHAKKLAELNERVSYALAPGNKDWDDYYREKALSQTGFIEDCLYRGRCFGAKSVGELAFYHFQKAKRRHQVLGFRGATYAIKTDLDGDAFNQTSLDESRDRAEFDKHTSFKEIANVELEFLYTEQNELTDELVYFFTIKSKNKQADRIAGFQGSALESPSSLNKALINTVAGAGFDGEAADFKRMKRAWFDAAPVTVSALPFVGYDKQSGMYVFQDFGVKDGQVIKKNPMGFLEAGKTRIKTSIRSLHIQHSEATQRWWDAYQTFGDNGRAACAFWIGSLFAEQIRAALGFYPFLEMSGTHGTGKSKMIEFLWRLIGRDDYEGTDLNKNSHAGTSRIFNQPANLPVVLIEGDREEKSKKGQFDLDALKPLYNGNPYRAIGAKTQGNDSIEYPFRGAIVVAQNNPVDGQQATLSRFVHLDFTARAFSDDDKKRFNQLILWRAKDLAGFLPETLKKERAFLEQVVQHFKATREHMAKLPDVRDNRVQETHALLMAITHALPVVLPISKDEQQATLNHIQHRAISRQQRLESEHPMVVQFWDVFHHLNEKPREKRERLGEPEFLLDHTPSQNVISIRLMEMVEQANAYRLPLPPITELKKLLPACKRPLFLESSKVINSEKTKTSVRVWQFQRHS